MHSQQPFLITQMNVFPIVWVADLGFQSTIHQKQILADTESMQDMLISNPTISHTWTAHQERCCV